jgi:hypothetical protein
MPATFSPDDEFPLEDVWFGVCVFVESIKSSSVLINFSQCIAQVVRYVRYWNKNSL